MNEKEAAQLFWRRYTLYRAKKSEIVTKNYLLPQQPETKDKKSDAIRNPPLSRNKHEEKQALLFHVDEKKHPVLFYKTGWELLFPFCAKRKIKTINLPLLLQYLNRGEDIRPWILEAYLRGRITKDSLLSLFQIHHFMAEFWEDKSSVTQHKPVKIFRIHEKGQLTAEAKEFLIPKLQPFSQTELDCKQFQSETISELSNISEQENFFAAVETPAKPIILLLHLLFRTPFSTNTYYKTPTGKNLIDACAQLCETKITVDEYNDISNLAMVQEKLKSIVTKDFPDDLKAAIESGDEGIIFKKYFESGIATLYHTVLGNLLAHPTAVEILFPIPRSHEKGISFQTILLNTQLHNLLLKTTTGKDPNSLLKKVPIFNSISVSTLNYLTEHQQRPIGLIYPGQPTLGKVHNSQATPYAYLAHDLYLHHDWMFFLRARGEITYQLLLKFVAIVRQITHHVNTQIVITILDFATPHYQFFYKTKESMDQHAITTINNNALYGIQHNDPATKEYAAIIYCDLIKNSESYKKFFKGFPLINHDSFLTELLSSLNLSFARKIHNDHPAEIIKYSHSLGAFMCLLYENYFESKLPIKEICDQLHLLEQNDLITFRWNKKDGIMLEIDKFSFRFRKKENDHRNERKYADNDNVIRKFSNEPSWAEDLATEIRIKMARMAQPTI